MTYVNTIKTHFASAILATAFSTAAMIVAPAAASAQSSAKEAKTLVLSVGGSQQINLGSAVADVVVADPAVADVQLTSSRQLYVIAKGPGETTVYATDSKGRNVYVGNIRVGGNINSLDQMLKLAMPDANIKITSLNGIVMLTGVVGQPEDAAEAQRLVEAFTNDGKTRVISRLRTATPQQVNLQVRVAEVSRSLAKEINGNLATRDGSNGVLFGIARGRNFVDIGNFDTSAFPTLDASSIYGLPAGTLSLPFNPQTGQFITGGTSFNFNNIPGGNVLQLAGKLFGVNVAAAFDLSERAGLTSTLANPNLTAVSGTTGSFLAGGRFPIPQSTGFGATTVTYENFGVGLTYTPTVLSDGRISLQIKTEVSDISSQGAVRLNGFEIPAVTTRMAETTVELGSGQSFMIAGLLSNSASTSIDKTPGIGDIPVLGALFKSNGWRRNETELMIIVTPYLVKPVSESEIKLPTDGLHTPNDLERVLLNKISSDKGDTSRPMPTVAPESKGPDFGAVSEAPAPLPKKAAATKAGASAPGFSFN